MEHLKLKNAQAAYLKEQKPLTRDDSEKRPKNLVVIGMRDDGIPLWANIDDLVRRTEIMRKPWP